MGEDCERPISHSIRLHDGARHSRIDDHSAVDDGRCSGCRRGRVRSLVPSATPSGDSVVVWPVHAMLLGLLASWLAFLLILLVPVLGPLRHGPGEHLRDQDV